MPFFWAPAQLKPGRFTSSPSLPAGAALENFKKKGRAIFYRPGKGVEDAALLVVVNEDSETGEFGE